MSAQHEQAVKRCAAPGGNNNRTGKTALGSAFPHMPQDARMDGGMVEWLYD